VGDEQQRQAELAAQLGQQVEHLCLDHHVQGGGRFVGDQQPRGAGQRHGDHHPLALAARQLVRVAGGPPGWQADLLQQLADAGVGRLVADLVVQVDRLGDLDADAPDRVEGVHGALEHDRRLGPAHRPQAARPHGEHVLAVQQHAAGGPGARRQQP
jgi:hypothetical protein